MDTRFTKKNNYKMLLNKLCAGTFIILNYFTKEGFIMLKLLAKVAEKYAKSTNTASAFLTFLHQPKMPAALIKKD